MINVQDAVQEAFDSVEATRVAIRDGLNGPTPPGLKPVDDATFMEFVAGMQQQFPPEPIFHADAQGNPIGTPVTESPWVMMLPFVDGGKPILDRILRIKEKGQMVAPPPVPPAMPGQE